MVELMNEAMKNCVDDFDTFYGQENYISKKDFDNWSDKYQDLFRMLSKYPDCEEENFRKMKIIGQNGYQLIEKRNENLINKNLGQLNDYFDNMFLNIDPNIKLDEEQRRAILIDEDYSLVIAGAGSGKTTTMAAKVKYLVEIKKVDPNQIILLAFTNKAAEELDERINNDFKLGVKVLTFHKLGADFIRKIKKEKVSIIDTAGQYSMLSGYMRNRVFTNKQLLRKLLEAFPNEVNFDKKCFEYETFEEYWKYFTKYKYEQCKENLKDENIKKIKRRLKYNKTINGEVLKSEGEVKIANYLYRKGINYQYEEIFPKKLNQGRTYKPDFTIYDLEEPVYIEYHGMAKLFRNGEITSVDNDNLESIYKRRKIHKKYGTDLIELFGNYEEKINYMHWLSYELKQRNLSENNRSEEDIFYRLMETSQDSLYFRFIHLVIEFIKVFKEQNYQKEDFDTFICMEKDETIRTQLRVIRAFYLQYEKDIRQQNRIDFADMINFAYRNMESLKENYKHLNFEYIIIDEYQDISKQRYNFAKKLSDLFNAKIVAVGDDWQAIFSFSGADVNLFTNFYEKMGYAEIIKITKTYRNSQELIDLAGDFVSKNTEQFQKRLVSNKHLLHPVQIIEYHENLEEDNNDISEKLNDLLLEIYKEKENSKILLLGRYKSDLDDIIESKYFKKGMNDKVILKSMPTMDIDFLTIHSAKGLGYDQVILLNALDSIYGFPSKVEDKPVIKLIKSSEKSTIDYPEERRLFYVALTRTKNKIYILCPEDIKYKSEFIKEIIGHDSVSIR